jgi:universal stress protein F
LYKKILVPIDLSHAEKASAMIDIAKSLAGDNLRLVLVNVVEDIPNYVSIDMPSGIVESQVKAAAEELHVFAEKSGIEAAVEVRNGQPASEILLVAKDHDVDLIIIASHRPGLQDYFLGSTAARVVRHAQCPVLVER